jgi:hypothetical protein
VEGIKSEALSRSEVVLIFEARLAARGKTFLKLSSDIKANTLATSERIAIETEAAIALVVS